MTAELLGMTAAFLLMTAAWLTEKWSANRYRDAYLLLAAKVARGDFDRGRDAS